MYSQELSPKVCIWILFVQHFSCYNRDLATFSLLFSYKVRGWWGGFALAFPWQHGVQWTHSWEEKCWPVTPHHDPLLLNTNIWLCMRAHVAHSCLLVKSLHQSHRNSRLKPSEGHQIQMLWLWLSTFVMLVRTFECSIIMEALKSESKVCLFSQDNSDKELRTLASPQVCCGTAADLYLGRLKWVQYI